MSKSFTKEYGADSDGRYLAEEEAAHAPHGGANKYIKQSGVQRRLDERRLRATRAGTGAPSSCRDAARPPRKRLRRGAITGGRPADRPRGNQHPGGRGRGWTTRFLSPITRSAGVPQR